MTDERLGGRYIASLAARRGGDRAGCVTPEELVGLAERSLPEPQRLRLFDHVMNCPQCREEFALADGVAGARAGMRRSSMPRVLAAAAVLLLVSGSVLLLRWSTRGGGSDPLRGEEPQLGLIAPAEQLAPELAVQFTWHSAGAGAAYRVELWDSGGVARYQSSTRDTTLALPDSIRLDRDRPYSWWVVASLPDGRQVASAIRRLRLITR